MIKNEVKKIIEGANNFNEFINGSIGYIDINVYNLPIRIYRKNVGAEMYYMLPYNKDFNYRGVVIFMKYAIPILTEMIEKERQKNLMGSDCVKVPNIQ